VTSTSEAHVGTRPAGLDGSDAVTDQLASHRRELTGFCYRMLGSIFDADDAVQETMVRAWQNVADFEGRSSLRSWLYRIATNVCLDMLRGRKRRARPMDLGPSSAHDEALGPILEDHAWVQPAPDGRVLPAAEDPAAVAESRETVRLAFVAALQHLPARQRAVLILCEVLRFRAAEVAELLDSSVASVTSALQRARATLAERDPAADVRPLAPDDRVLLEGYVDAFERYDVDRLVRLLHADVVFSMPPYDHWLQGPDNVVGFLVGQGHGCRGSRLVPVAVNGGVGFASYRSDGSGGHAAFSIQVHEIRDGAIIGYHNYLGPQLFEAFGLPLTL
jgi:RNA polymerase sigma-70 factor (ECF subfamily)